MEFHFCDKCGRKISEDELDSGEALMMGEEFFCGDCKDSALTEMAGSSTERAAPPIAALKSSKRRRSARRPSTGRRKSGPKKAASERAGRTSGPKPVSTRVSSRRSAVRAGGKGTNLGVIVGAVAALAAIAVVAVVMLGGDGDVAPPEDDANPGNEAAAPGDDAPAAAPVVKAPAVGVPEGAKGANDFAVEEPADGPGRDCYKLITGETPLEIQAAKASKGWTVLRSKDAKRAGDRGFSVTPKAAAGAEASSGDQLAIVVSRAADLSDYGKLGLWVGGRNVGKNLVKVAMVVGDEEISLTGAEPVEYGTEWKFRSFDLAGKRDDVRGLILYFNASEPPSPATFEFWIDEVVAYNSGKDEPKTVDVASKDEPDDTTTAPPVRPRLGPRRRPPAVDEPDDTTAPPTPAVPGPRVPRPPRRGVPEPIDEPAGPGESPTPASPDLPAETGGFKVFWREKFDSGKPDGWDEGTLETQTTYNGSAGAFKCALTQDGNYCKAYIAAYRLPRPKRPANDALFTAADDVYISFQYHLSGVTQFSVQAWNNRASNNMRVQIRNAVVGKWTPVMIKVMDLSPDGKEKPQVGDPFRAVTVYGKPEMQLVIDDFAITKGKPTNIEAQVARANRLTAEQTADPAKDGYFLLPAVIDNLKKHYKADAVTVGRALKVGGDAAASLYHLKSVKGLRPVKRFTICGKLKGAADVTAKFGKELAEQKPQFVTLMFGTGDMAKNRQSMEVRTHYVMLIEKTLQAGAIPVLFTLPLPMTGNKDADKIIGDYNKMILSLGKEKSVPVVDAHAILMKDPDKLGKYFSAMKLKKAGHEAVDGPFAKLYESLSAHVAGK